MKRIAKPLVMTTLVSLVFLTGDTGLLSAQEGASNFQAAGLVLERQKYSFIFQTHEQRFQVVIPNGTPILLRLVNPKIDLENRMISYPLFMSAANGKEQDNEVLSWPLPDPLFISRQYEDESTFNKVKDERVPVLDRYVMSAQAGTSSEFELSGELTASRLPGQYFLNDRGRVFAVTLAKRRGLLNGFSITDLKPGQTSVWVQGNVTGDRVVATRIRFEYLGDPTIRFENKLPKLLSLGDLNSHDYHRPLIEALQGKVNVHHPPMWVGPSKHWKRLTHYVGTLDPELRQWDVITFNYGLRDQNETRENYQQNLRNAIQLLERTKAKLIWVTSAPLPGGLSAADPNQPLKGHVKGRMGLQNRWAEEVLKEFPQVAVCDIHSVVKSQLDGVFKSWNSRDHLDFGYQQGVVMGRVVAQSVLTALNNGESLNPLSVHDSEPSQNVSR